MSKTLRYIAIASVFFQIHLHAAEWSLLVYMQADNNLSDCVEGDLSEMIKAYQQVRFVVAGDVNTLVQIDLPSDKKTWRFKIDATGKIDDGTMNEEMGVHPVEELVKSGLWMKNMHPAKHYGIILWNHGSGTEDYRGISLDSLNYDKFWTQLGSVRDKNKNPGKAEKIKSKIEFFEKGLVDKRGILYDDSDKTCLTNQGLTSALTQIRDILGKKIDFIGMDACLMAMVEVAYQMKDLVEVFVGSQEVEPGSGWQYNTFLSALLSNPTLYTPAELAVLAVKSYGQCYSRSNCTLSAINMNMMNPMCENINAVATSMLDCLKYGSSSARTALRTARANSMKFDVDSYIDLYSFYAALHTEVVKLRQAAEDQTPTCWGFCKPSAKYIPALDALTQHLVDGMALVGQFVFANAATGNKVGAMGVSIYFPSSILKIHGTYPKTLFAQEIPSWYNLIKKI